MVFIAFSLSKWVYDVCKVDSSKQITLICIEKLQQESRRPVGLYNVRLGFFQVSGPGNMKYIIIYQVNEIIYNALCPVNEGPEELTSDWSSRF